MEKASMKRVLSGFLVVLIMVFSFTSMPTFTASATNKTSDEALNWVRSQVGQQKGDGQCVALIKAYYEYLGVASPSVNSAWQYKDRTPPSGWQVLSGAQPQPGDILIYTGTSAQPHGHVAIYEANNITYHQNYAGQLSVRKVTNIAYNHSGITSTTPYWGIIRPNWSGSTPAPLTPIDLGEHFMAAIIRTDVWTTVINNNGSVELGPERGYMTENWWFERQSDGSYTIRSVEDSKMLDVHLSGNVNGTAVKMAEANGGNAQKWFIYGNGAAYRLVPKCSPNLNLDVVAGATNHGAKMQLFEPNGSKSQVFSIYKSEIRFIGNLGANFDAAITQKSSNRPIMNNVNDNNVVLGNGNNGLKERWKFTRFADGTYTIRSYENGMFLEASPDGNNVRVGIANNSSAQRWYMHPIADGWMLWPKSQKAQSKCMDLTANSSISGTNIQLKMSDNSAAQIFYITKSTTKMVEEFSSINGRVMLEVNQTTGLNISVRPSGATIGNVKWTSNNTMVATVDNRGFVTGRSAGSVTITAVSTFDSSIKASITIEVVAATPTPTPTVRPTPTASPTATPTPTATPKPTQTPTPTPAITTGWRSEGTSTVYYNTSGNKVTGWQTISNKTFYFDKSGKMLTGWQDIDGKKFFFKRTGVDGTRGYMHTGWNTIDGKKFFFKRTGVDGTRGHLHTGWHTIDGKKFFFKRTGVNGTIGHLHTGWNTIDGKKFFFKRTGANGTIGHLHTGWHTIDGKRFYFKRTGANGTIGHLHTGWHTIDKKRVYFDSKGVHIPTHR